MQRPCLSEGSVVEGFADEYGLEKPQGYSQWIPQVTLEYDNVGRQSALARSLGVFDGKMWLVGVL